MIGKIVFICWLSCIYSVFICLQIDCQCVHRKRTFCLYVHVSHLVLPLDIPLYNRELRLLQYDWNTTVGKYFWNPAVDDNMHCAVLTKHACNINRKYVSLPSGVTVLVTTFEPGPLAIWLRKGATRSNGACDNLWTRPIGHLVEKRCHQE